MRRRDFLSFLTTLASISLQPRKAYAGAAEPVRRIGLIFTFSSNDPPGNVRIAAFVKRLQELGWRDGDNLRIDCRFAAGDADRMQSLAQEIVEARPDVIITNAPWPISIIRRQTQAIPIVFTMMSDPVDMGVLTSLSHPGNNITGFTSVEYSIVSKWLQLLKQIAPRVTRIGLMFNPGASYGNGTPWLRHLVDAASRAAIEPAGVPVHSASDINATLAGLGAEQRSGLLVATDTFTSAYHAQIAGLALEHRVPGCYPFRYYAAEGGLLSYGPEGVEVYRRSASYADRILRGENVTNLPVQAPAKFELVINAKTARAFQLDIPPALLIRADEVIE